jgi:hypothetical protein
MKLDEAILEKAAKAVYEANPMRRSSSRNVGDTGLSTEIADIPWEEIVENGNLTLYCEMAQAAIAAFIQAESERHYAMMPKDGRYFVHCGDDMGYAELLRKLSDYGSLSTRDPATFPRLAAEADTAIRTLLSAIDPPTGDAG